MDSISVRVRIENGACRGLWGAWAELSEVVGELPLLIHTSFIDHHESVVIGSPAPLSCSSKSRSLDSCETLERHIQPGFGVWVHDILCKTFKCKKS